MNKILECLQLKLPEDVEKCVMYGDFNKAEELIDIYMKRNISELLKKRLEYEKHIMKVIKEDYIYSFDEAYDMACDKIKEFTREELEELKDERFADWVYINGKVMFNRRFLGTVTSVCNKLSPRLIDVDEESKKKREFLYKTIDEIIEKGEKQYSIKVKTGIKLTEKAARKGEQIRVHIPIPKPAVQIKNIKILSTVPEKNFIAPEETSQRTICFEKTVEGEDEFSVEYSYENHIKYNDLDPSKVSEVQPTFYTDELSPHIIFTPFLKDLTEEIIEDESNSLLKARKIYDYITKYVQYSFMRPYSSIVNIPEYAAYNLKGDCGVQALLFINLCRIAGIPARWQSGLYVNPYSVGCHDWAQFYIEPYGWLFADLSFGGSAYSRGNTKVWNYYFGNLDPFRMVANSDFQGDFTPEKKFFRIDPYDNQVGEAEYSDSGLCVGDFESIKEIVDIHECPSTRGVCREDSKGID